MLEPKLLIYLAVIGEQGTITGAARKLSVAQPWLSTQMKKLEGQLGFRLFERSARGVVFTQKGEAFLSAAVAVETAVDLASRTALQLKHSDRFTLRVGSPPYSGHFDTRAKLVDTFSFSRQDISLEIHVGWTPALLERLHSAELDLTFATLPRDRHGTLQVKVLELRPVDLFLRADDILAAQPEVSPAQLGGRTLLSFTKNLHPDLFDYIYGESIAAGAAVRQTAEFSDAVWTAATDDRRHIVSHIQLTTSEMSDHGLVRRALKGVTVPFCLVRRKGKLSAAAETFWSDAGVSEI